MSAHKSFKLPINDRQSVQVVYQKPAAYDAPVPKTAPARRNIFKRQVPNLAVRPSRKPVIIMMHGFPGGHKGGCDDLFGEMEYRLEGLGYPTIRFDFRGCGESDGREEDFSITSGLEDLNAVIQWAQHDAGHRSIILMGEGVGANIAALGYTKALISGLVFLWPFFQPEDSVFANLPEASPGHVYATFNGNKIGHNFISEIKGMDMEATLRAITAPALIQHGALDRESPVSQAYFARDTLGGPVDIAIFEGGGHGLRALNMRQHLFMNLRYFLDQVFKKLDSSDKN